VQPGCAITDRQPTCGVDQRAERLRERVGDVVGSCRAGRFPAVLKLLPSTARGVGIGAAAIRSISHLPFSQQKVCVGFGSGPTAQELLMVRANTAL
jgi:hypothetical protein